MGIFSFIKRVFTLRLNDDEKISDTREMVSEIEPTATAVEKVDGEKPRRREIFSGYFEGHYTRIIART